MLRKISATCTTMTVLQAMSSICTSHCLFFWGLAAVVGQLSNVVALPVSVTRQAVAGAGGYQQQQQVAAWKAYLAWECSNPQRLADPDLTLRVNLAYDQALMTLRFYPDVRHPQLTQPACACQMVECVTAVMCVLCMPACHVRQHVKAAVALVTACCHKCMHTS